MASVKPFRDQVSAEKYKHIAHVFGLKPSKKATRKRARKR